MLDQPAWLTILLLSHADNFFYTPHQRRLLLAERPLPALFGLLPFPPSLPCLRFLSHLTFPSCASSLLPISCTEFQALSATCKKKKKDDTENKIPFLLCRLYLFTLSPVFLLCFSSFQRCFITASRPFFQYGCFNLLFLSQYRLRAKPAVAFNERVFYFEMAC